MFDSCCHPIAQRMAWRFRQFCFIGHSFFVLSGLIMGKVASLNGLMNVRWPLFGAFTWGLSLSQRGLVHVIWCFSAFSCSRGTNFLLIVALCCQKWKKKGYDSKFQCSGLNGGGAYNWGHADPTELIFLSFMAIASGGVSIEWHCLWRGILPGYLVGFHFM